MICGKVEAQTVEREPSDGGPGARDDARTKPAFADTAPDTRGVATFDDGATGVVAKADGMLRRNSPGPGVWGLESAANRTHGTAPTLPLALEAA